MYDIVTIPDAVLKTEAAALDGVNDAVRTQMDAMLKAMYDAPGIGLAANQVGLLNRVLVMDLADTQNGEEAAPICMANPEILWQSDDISTMEEGCLSIPGQVAEVSRPAQVRVRYLDYDGKLAELEADGLLSHCVQHEIDHLNGVLFVDHLSALKRNMVIKKFKKAQKAGLL